MCKCWTLSFGQTAQDNHGVECATRSANLTMHIINTNMASKGVCFEHLVKNWAILEPDIGCQDIVSFLACAILCSQQSCTTMNLLPMDSVLICQMSKRKGTCMEKEEAFVNQGAHMYQRKVDMHNYRLFRRLSFVPTIKTKTSPHFVFHPTRPLIMVFYSEASIPFNRLLVYGTTPPDPTWRLQFNSSYYAVGQFPRGTSQYVSHTASNYIIYVPLRRSGGNLLIGDGKLYDFLAGKFIGRLIIPPREKCIRASPALPFVTADMACIAFYCLSSKSESSLSISVYDVLRKYIDNSLICKLVRKRTTVIVIQNQHFSLLVSVDFRFFLGSDGGFVISFPTAVEFIIFRDIQQGLNKQRRCTLSVTGKVNVLTDNPTLGLFLGYTESSQSTLHAFAVSCRKKKPLILRYTDKTVTPIRITLHGSAANRQQFKQLEVEVDNRMNILQIYWQNRRQGNPMNGVKMYEIC
ncbi:uncharacterized protein LOC135487286 isoform X2 [Lineus longissimus]|uniref:uncharacterized protein LOC135487286 isoform X2 n=1 Tax=Lineus longissimus TaxID=88925 RepID=UPI00315DA473